MRLNEDKCPICAYQLSVDFFDGGAQTLTTLGWPKSYNEAVNMVRYPLNYVQCPQCTHIWNNKFSYDAIPYEDNPNRMFNSGVGWKDYMRYTIDQIAHLLPKHPTVVDVGCGEGHFVRSLAKALGNKGRFIGFDPNTTEESGKGIEFFAEYFDPIDSVVRFEPDLIIMRHVLEHLSEPSLFVQKLAISASKINKKIHFFAETPCVDKAVENYRIVDFFYEHPAQFTSASFNHLMSQSGRLISIEKGYNEEVIFGLSEVGVKQNILEVITKAQNYMPSVQTVKNTINDDLKKILESKAPVVIWGGTGKAAAFIQFFGLHSAQFPDVVDSDPSKLGTFVPGAGQVIQSPDQIKSGKDNVILIPTQWRAKDIVGEIRNRKISYKKILLEYQGQLVDYEVDAHPY